VTDYVIELWRTSGTPALVSRRYSSQTTAVIMTSHSPGAGTHTYALRVATHPQSGGGGTGHVGDRVMHATVHKR
jgi:hypothetical protein